ncbi:MAG: SDR family oxidoreductase [Rhodobacteraceae bacterium]|nr:SDR family oxidoreductase [Paracoccaceae bacterium]RZW02831.1 MAG: SDR family oxidoreductase [Paracoccaceae bacterium]
MFDMSGKTVMVTGASRGIGAAAARVFAAAGANVALLARSQDAIATLAGEIGPSAVAIPCNVARYTELQGATEALLDTFGAVDVLINNAGVIEPVAHMANSDPDDWGQVIDINLKGVYYGMRAVLPAMIEAGGGSVLTVSSGAAHGPVEAWSHYCASKAGAAMLTRCLHLENAGDGIRAMGLSPGTVATEMQREIKASGINRISQLDWSEHIPPEWPAKALLWMCSPEADKYCGQEISLRDVDIRAMIGLSGG